MNLRRKIFIDTSSYVLSSFITKAVSLILIPYYLKFIDKSEFGIYDWIILGTSIVQIIFTLEIAQGVARFLPSFRTIQSKKNLISTSLIFSISGYLFFALIAGLIITFNGYIFNNVNVSIQVLGINYIVINGIFLTLQSYLRWDKRSVEFTISTIIYASLNVLISFLTLGVYKLGFPGILVANIISNLISSFYIIYRLKNLLYLKFSKRYYDKLIKFSAPLVFSSISIFIATYTDRIVLTYYLTLNELGEYSLAFRFASIIGVLGISIGNAITPQVYTNPRSIEVKTQLLSFYKYYVMGGVLVIFLSSILGKILIPKLLGPDYGRLIILLPYMCLYMLIKSTYFFFPGLYISGKTKTLSIIAIISNVINLILNICLVQIYSIEGVVISTIISSLISTCAIFILGEYHFQTKFGKLSLVSLAMVISFLFLSFFLEKTIKTSLSIFLLQLTHFMISSLILYKMFLSENKTSL